MKLGLVSAILDGWTFEEMLETVSAMGFQCVEVACWPQGKAERRYAGVSHIDVARVLEDDQYAKYVLDSFAVKSEFDKENQPLKNTTVLEVRFGLALNWAFATGNICESGRPGLCGTGR